MGPDSRRQERMESERILKRRTPGECEQVRRRSPHGYPPTPDSCRRFLRLGRRIHEPHVAASTPIGRYVKHLVQGRFHRILRVGFPARPALASWAFVEPGPVPEIPEGQTHQLTSSRLATEAPGQWRSLSAQALAANVCKQRPWTQ